MFITGLFYVGIGGNVTNSSGMEKKKEKITSLFIKTFQFIQVLYLKQHGPLNAKKNDKQVKRSRPSGQHGETLTLVKIQKLAWCEAGICSLNYSGG